MLHAAARYHRVIKLGCRAMFCMFIKRWLVLLVWGWGCAFCLGCGCHIAGDSYRNVGTAPRSEGGLEIQAQQACSTRLANAFSHACLPHVKVISPTP